MAQAKGGVIIAWAVLILAARLQTSVTFSRTSQRTLTSFITRAWAGIGMKDSNSDTGKEGPCTEAQPPNTMNTATDAKIAKRRNPLGIMLLPEIIICHSRNH
jgi:hypothetical protein